MEQLRAHADRMRCWLDTVYTVQSAGIDSPATSAARSLEITANDVKPVSSSAAPAGPFASILRSKLAERC